MKIKSIEWKNICSYGNRVEKVVFDGGGSLWQFYGKSGAGKSTVLLLPQLLFYGKAGKLKVGCVANRINRNGWIRGVVQTGQDEYVVERTFSPQGVKVWRNGESLDRANTKDVQEIIENEVMEGLPYGIFSNVINLSFDTFKSFMVMTPEDRRKIIDRIFSVDMVNRLHEMVKTDIKELGNAINITSGQIFALNTSIARSKAELAALKEKSDYTPERSEGEIEGMMEGYRSVIAKSTEEFNAYNEKSRKIMDAIGRYRTEEARVAGEIRQREQKVRLLSSDRCPTCGTPFDGGGFPEMKEALEAEIEALRAEGSGYEADRKRLEEGLGKIDALLGEVNATKTEAMRCVGECMAEIEKIKGARNINEGIMGVESIISSGLDNISKMQDRNDRDNDTMGLLSRLERLYGADGVKGRMMEDYIPTLNEEIGETLGFLHYPYTMEFDSEFGAHVAHLGEEIDVETLSKGERKKIDLSVLCSIIRVIKRKYPQINMVCLDETLSGLDAESVRDVVEYLKGVSSEMGLNIFVISHEKLDESVFDHRVRVEKTDGFSSMEETV